MRASLAAFASLALSCLAEEAFPALFYSYKLVPGLKGSVDHSEQMPFNIPEVESLLSRAFEECLSDAYVIAVIPGLKVDDFANFGAFENLRRSLTKSSTILSMPNVLSNEDHQTLDLDKLERSLSVYCNAKYMHVDGADGENIPKYLDARIRSIRMEFPPLRGDSTEEARLARLKNYDEALYKLQGNMPSPLVSILITSNTTQPVDLDAITDPETVIRENEISDDPHVISVQMRETMRVSKRMIFPDITVFDKSRYYEYERNKQERRNIKDKSKDDTWLGRKKKEIVLDRRALRFGADTKGSASAWDNKTFIEDNILYIGIVLLLFVVMVSADALKMMFGIVKRALSKSRSSSQKKKKD